MYKLLVGLLALCSLYPAYAGNRVGVSLDANVSGTVFSTDYNIGFAPSYHRTIGEKKELMVSVPIHFWGTYLGNGEPYTIRTTYTTIGLDVGYFYTMFSAARCKISFGPEVYGNYALPPTTVTTLGGVSNTDAHASYVIGSAGICAPVNVDVLAGNHFGLRLTERILRLSAQAVLDDRLMEDNYFVYDIGLKPVLEPSLALLYTF